MSDYRWLCENFAGRPQKQRIKKPKRLAKQIMLAETRIKVIEMRFGQYKDIYDPETAVIKHTVVTVSKAVRSNYHQVQQVLKEYMKHGYVRCFFRKPSS
jgi:hypothetical protein